MNETVKKSLLCAAALLGCAAAPSHAAVLFMDTYVATSNQTPNDQLSNPGRQSGLYATLGYIDRGNVQIGNTGTLPQSPGSGLGNELLTASGGVAVINHDFSNETLPLEVSWTGIISSRSGGTINDWTAITIGSSTGAPFVNSTLVDSVLMRTNGGTQIFDHSAATTGLTGTGTGLDTWGQYAIILSDLAGTGSAFGTGGSEVSYYMNGTLVGTQVLTQLHSGEGYFGFTSNIINGYDNVTVQTVPEPSAAVAGLAGLAGLALIRRRR